MSFSGSLEMRVDQSASEVGKVEKQKADENLGRCGVVCGVLVGMGAQSCSRGPLV